jgi:hypothetical protein
MSPAGPWSTSPPAVVARNGVGVAMERHGTGGAGRSGHRVVGVTRDRIDLPPGATPPPDRRRGPHAPPLRGFFIEGLARLSPAPSRRGVRDPEQLHL